MGLMGPVRSLAMLSTTMCAALEDGRMQCWGLSQSSAALLPTFSSVSLP